MKLGIGLNLSRELSGKTLQPTTGVFLETGYSTTLSHVRTLSTSNGSFTETGNSATLTYTPAAWDPSQFGSALQAWFRGDVGSTTSWTPKSGTFTTPTNAGTITTTTLGGQPAFVFSGTSNCFLNTTDNIITAGSIYTVLSVAQASNSQAGAIFTLRNSGPYSSSQVQTLAGTSYVYGDGVAQNISLVSSVSTEAQSPFLAEWSYNGSGNAMTKFRMNRTDRSQAGGTQTTESGTAGFRIGSNSASQGWVGSIAEIVIINRAITSTERTNWEGYVNTRYGI